MSLLTIKILLPIIFFVCGTIFASFGNMLMYRLANDKPIIKDSRSYCPKCNHQIAWYDNIPLISFLVLRGKCRHCHEPISKRYFLVELFGGLSFLVVYFLYVCLYPTKSFELSTNYLDFINAVTYAFTLLFLLIAAYVDKKKMEVPLSMMVTMLFFALINFVFSWIINGFELTRLLGFVVPAAILLLVYFICVLLIKTEPMGLADIIIFSILGLELGIFSLLSIILFSSLICSVVELIKIKKTGEKQPIPFVPYIFMGTLITMLFFPLIIEGLTTLMGGLWYATI